MTSRPDAQPMRRSAAAGETAGEEEDDFWADFLSYETVKMVRIRSVTLGVLHWMFLLGICLYLAIAVFGMQKEYLLKEVPVGNARMEIRDPCNPAKKADYCQAGDNNKTGIAGVCGENENFRCKHARYCAPDGTTNTSRKLGSEPGKQLRCRYWDHNQVVWPPSESMAMSIATRAELFHQELRLMNGSACDNQMEADCQWYPPADYHGEDSNELSLANSYYLGDIGNFTVTLYHLAHGVSLKSNIMAGTHEGWLMQCKPGRTCDPSSPSEDYQKYKHLPVVGKPDEMLMQDLIDAASPLVARAENETGFDLDAMSDACPGKCGGLNSTYRYVGAVLSVTILYDNSGLLVPESDNWWGIGTGTTKYQIRVSIQKSSTFAVQVTQHMGGTNTNRTVHHLHGIRMLIGQTGSITGIEFNTLLLQGSVAVGLIAVATTIVDFLMQYIMPDKEEYGNAKYEEIKVDHEHSLLGNLTYLATAGMVDADGNPKQDEEDPDDPGRPKRTRDPEATMSF